MQCVLLAAGRGERLRPLTDEIPKPLIKVCERTIIDHLGAALPPEITELVVVVGYRAEQIKEHCGEMFYSRPVTYVEQVKVAGGTGEALMSAQGKVGSKFLLLNGDDIYGADALQKIVREDHAVFGSHSDTPERFGVLMMNEDGTLKEIIEKPKMPPSNFVNIGGYVLNSSIFDYEVGVSRLGEVLVTDMITKYAKDNPIKIIEQDLWLPVGCPEHIHQAECILKTL